MSKSKDLNRFIMAQRTDYADALSEMKRGRKTNHWMWYIFPQIQGLGFSETSRFYAIENTEEAQAYLAHPVLGSRLIEISNELLKLESSNARNIFGSPDDMKLKSSMTLFASLPSTDPVFQKVLVKFFEGKHDEQTSRILSRGS